MVAVLLCARFIFMKQSLGVSYKAIYPDGPAITKLWFGKKFMIWKFKDLLSGVPLLAQQLASKSIKHRLKSLKEDDLFFTAVKYIVKNKIDSIKVEVLFRSTQPHELLLKETSHLNNVFGNDECLNQNSEP
jgi:hypothetical protein